jgi:hypothetical protein
MKITVPVIINGYRRARGSNVLQSHSEVAVAWKLIHLHTRHIFVFVTPNDVCIIQR